MQFADFLTGMGLYIGFILAIGLPLILIKFYFKIPFEVTRKLYHLVITLSIFPLVRFFNAWYLALLAMLMFAALAYVALKLVEHTAVYKHIAVERSSGEFKSSLLVVQASIGLVIFIFWGLLGAEWKFIAVVAVIAWGFGDAAAALVGKAFGRRKIQHPWIEGAKTLEGTQAMYFTAAAAVFSTLLIFSGLAWSVSLAIALLVAPVCAAVELFSRRGMDTLTVPISTGLAVLSCMVLFSFLGI